MKLGLRHKLLIMVQVYLVLLACVGLMGLHAAQVSIDRLHIAAKHHLREVNLVGDIASVVGRIHRSSLLHALSDSSEARQGYEEHIAQMESHVDSLVEEFQRSEAMFGDKDDQERSASRGTRS
jgi:Four helix bundle sensory module for signal transduction